VTVGRYEYRKLVHGTTLHGTQVTHHDRHILDDFQLLTVANPWDNVACLGAIQMFDMRQEPLTYYHRTGPVGAMFAELTRRGKDKEHVAMVGLGTGSVSCYAQKGQRLTFYEIDPAVRRLVEKPWKVMNEKELRERGCAPVSDPEVRQLVEKLRGVTIVDQATYDEKMRAYTEELHHSQRARGRYIEELARRKAAGEPPPEGEAPKEPTPPPAVPDIGPFTYVDDARKRGAEVDFKMGDARLKLKEDTDRKYALLLVDAFSSDSIPVHLLTVEAVELYMNRLTEDGILALHISNKYISLEPVVAAIAEKHNLVARVWNDDDKDGRYGKTASSWVVLARKPEDLGERLCNPIGDLMAKYHHRFQLMDVLTREYPELRSLLEKGGGKQRETILGFLDKRIGDPQAARFASWIRKAPDMTVVYDTLMDILKRETGYGFRPLHPLKNLPPWTDDYADVMRVMMIPQLQSLRRFFGLPTLDEE
jgi:spermidine synthase